jgi:hypothetical protein
MADEKEGFKITDRRKFNPDGTPRDQPEQAGPSEPASAAPATAEQAGPAPADEQGAAEQAAGEQPQPQEQAADTAGAAGAGNVVSFPGEGAKKEADRKRGEAGKPDAEPEREAARAQSPASASAERAYSQASHGKATSLPQASFVGLVNMLGIEAAMHLGLVENPAGGGSHLDLDAARHMIDLLGVLEEKTRGNLAPEEDSLLENMLADLRMQYVMRSKRQ